MKIQLYKEVIPSFSAREQILHNRGIDLFSQDAWLHPQISDISPWTELNHKDKMVKAIRLVERAIETDTPILINVDPDVDGFTSAAMLINFLFDKFPVYAKDNIGWILHEGKEHGLKDIYSKIVQSKNESKSLLVICPDSSSNDLSEHQLLEEEGIHVLCLDHHECSAEVFESTPATIVNVQLGEYPNKALTGAGVVYQFIQGYNDLIFGEKGDPYNYLDLCALGNCGDMSSYLQLETRAITHLGFANITNPFFKGFVEKNAYIIDKRKGLNYLSMAFAVVPFINAVVRSGTMEDKEMVFSAMLNHLAFDEVPSSKRGQQGVPVPRWSEAILVTERAKRKQTKLQDESMALLEQRIKEQNLLRNSMLIVCCEPGEVEKNIAGLVANKLQAKYQRPAAVLIRSKGANDKEYFYRGSMRNYSLSKISNLKDVLEETGEVEFVAGHQGAAGLGVAESKLSALHEKMNLAYSEIDQSPTYWVDYIWNSKNEIETNRILEIADLDIYGQEIPESKVALTRVPFSSKDVTLMGLDKGRPTLKIQLGDLSIIKFGSSIEEYEKFTEDNQLLTAVLTCNKNEWMGKVSPQLIIEDYELDREWVF